MTGALLAKRAIKAFKKGVLYHGENCNRGPKNDPPILEPRWLYMTYLLGRLPLAWSIACQPSRCWCCCTMPKRSPAKRDFRDNGERKIKKSKEGASSSTSKVDEDLVRSFCLFSVMAPLFTFSRIRGKLIWFLVQLFNTSSDFLEWKKRLIHEEANIIIILLSQTSLKRENVLFSMIEGKLPRHMTWSALVCNPSISWVYLGVRTCELFLCFTPFVFLRSIVLTSLFPLFYVTCEFNRFLHRGWADFHLWKSKSNLEL